MATRLITLTGGGPWGFTLSGGRDFGSHFMISKVTPGGKAGRGGVKEGNYILAINGDSMEGLLHFDAQQMIKATGMSLQMKLSTEPPKSPAVPTKFGHTAEEIDHGASRPRPPPPPSGSPSSKPATYTTTTYTPPPPRPPVVKSAVAPEPKAQESSLVPESGLDAGSSSTQQSPAFKRITVQDPPTPSVLSPHPQPPTQQMQNVRIEEGNVIKTSQRPAPPPNVPSKVTTSTVKVRKDAPIPKPQPPPSVPKPAPPRSPGEQKASPEVAAKLHERQGMCASCSQPIRGPFASAMGRVWHPEHFVCSSCHKELHSTTFVFEDEKIFCEQCYETNFAKTCHKCQRPVFGNAIAALGLHWHVEHFRCSNCNTDLSQGDGFNMEDDKLFCGDCFGQKYGGSCYGCNGKIGGNELWIEALENKWHSQCFVCTSCRQPLEGTTFFAKLQRPYCRNCA